MAKRSIGFDLNDVLEEAQCARNLRSEIARWFPSSNWVAQFDCPRRREMVRADRRAFMLQLGAGAGLLLPTAGCAGEGAAVVGVVFEAIKVAASSYAAGSAAGGSAIFSNDSPSREKAQLLTALTFSDSEEVQDEEEELVPVPGRSRDWVYAYEGLISSLLGPHFIAGTAAGITLLTKVFRFI